MNSVSSIVFPGLAVKTREEATPVRLASKIFFLILAIDLVLTPLSLTLGHAKISQWAWHFFKLPFVGYFLVIILIHLWCRIQWNAFSLLFLAAGFVAVYVGLVRNEVDWRFISHVYSLSLPVLGTSFGILMVKNWSRELQDFATRSLWAGFLMMIPIVVAYYTLYKVGRINYFGMTTYLFLISALFLSGKRTRPFLFVATMILILLTGKRGVLVAAVVPLLVRLVPSGKMAPRQLRSTVLFLLAFLVVGLGAYSAGFLRRFAPVLTAKYSDPYSRYVATSGRDQEILSLLRSLSTSPESFLIGAGAGATFLEDINLPPLVVAKEVKHYSHFSPCSYLLIGGLGLPIMMYALLAQLFFRGFRLVRDEYFFLGFSSMLTLSFFGALPFVDSRFWIFTGAVLELARKREQQESKRERLSSEGHAPDSALVYAQQDRVHHRGQNA